MRKFLMMIICAGCAFSATAQMDAPRLILPSPEAFSFTKYGDVPVGLFTGTLNYSVPVMQLQSGKINLPITLDYSTNGVKVNEVSGRTGMGWSLRTGGVITRNIIGKADDVVLLTAPSTEDTSSIYFYNYMKDVVDNSRNTQPDEFTYSFMGYSGKFYYDFSGNIKQLTQSGIKIVSTDTLKTFQVTTPDGVQYYFGGLAACDYTDSYNLYVEEDPLYTYAQGGRSAWYLTKIKNPSGDSVLFNYSWVSNSLGEPIDYVSNIQQTQAVRISPDDTNIGDWFIYSGNCVGAGTLGNGYTDGFMQATCANYFLTTTYSASLMSVVKLDEIVFKQGILRLYYSDRDDLPGEQKLDSLVLFSKTDNRRVKKTGFKYSYTTSSPKYNLPMSYLAALYGSTSFQDHFPYLKKRLFLDTLSFIAADNSIEKQSYAFNYDGRDSLPARLSFAQDLFGYFNGKENASFYNNNTFLNPFIGASIGATGNRDVDTAFTKNGVLSKITYPTGGSTKVSYENNYLVGAEKKVFDTVVAEITDPALTPVVYSSSFNSKIPFQLAVTASYVTPFVYDPMAPVIDTFIVVRIEDATTGDCVAICNVPLNAGHSLVQYYWALRATENYSSLRIKLETTNPNVKATAQFIYYELVSYVHNKPSGGLRVGAIENFTGNGSKVSHKKFLYNTPSDTLSSGGLINDFQDGRDFAYVQRSMCTTPAEFMGANYVLSSSSSMGGFSNDYLSVNYEYVTEYNDSLGTGGSTQTRFHIQGNQLPMAISCVRGDHIYDFSPSLIPGVPYSNTATLNGKEINKTVFRNHNGSYVKTKEIKNYYSVDTRLFDIDSIHVIRRPFTRSSYIPGYKYYSDFDFNMYKRISSWSHIDSVVEKNYDNDARELTVKTEYEYGNSDHLQQTKVKTVKGNGDVAINATQYAHDLSLSSLVSRNFIAVPVLMKDSVNSIQTARRKTGYAFWGSNIAPDSIMKSKGTNPLESDLVFTLYDPNSNPLEFTVNGQVNSLLMDTSLNLMVAGCQDAAFASIAATSFESGYKGNWDYSTSGIRSDSGSTTGVKSFKLDVSHNIERTALDADQTYLLTYWIKDNGGSMLVDGGGGGSLLLTKNGWKLYQKEITGTTSVTLTGTGVVDELRLYPKNGQMTTYTYEPLVGITSQCDANNRIVYYEYDALGRLLRIRDHDKNILKTYSYTYQETQ